MYIYISKYSSILIYPCNSYLHAIYDNNHFLKHRQLDTTSISQISDRTCFDRTQPSSAVLIVFIYKTDPTTNGSEKKNSEPVITGFLLKPLSLAGSQLKTTKQFKKTYSEFANIDLCIRNTDDK